MLELFWMCIAQPSLELMVGRAAACHDQISVKRKYSGLETFTYKQAEMLWVLLTRRHTLCSSCNIDPALWHEWDPSAAMRVSSDNYRAKLQWQRTYSQPYASSLLLYRPTTSVTWMRVPDPLALLLTELPQGQLWSWNCPHHILEFGWLQPEGSGLHFPKVWEVLAIEDLEAAGVKLQDRWFQVPWSVVCQQKTLMNYLADM